MDQNEIDALMNQMPEPDDAGAPSGEGASVSASAGQQADDPAGGSAEEMDALLREAQQLAGETPTAASRIDSEAPTANSRSAAGTALDSTAETAEDTATGLQLDEIALPEFDISEVARQANQPLSLLYDVEMHVKIELGRTHMFVEDVLKLGEGSVVELDRLAGDPVDVFVNGRLVARGEVLVLNDNFCVRVSEIIADSQKRRVG
jgi:flagellar motor switch protein FliN/FliY